MGTDLIKEELSIGQMFGSLGGRKTLDKYGKEYFKELSKKAMKARQEKGQIKKTAKI